MPVLDNQRQEIFCQGVAMGKTHEQAYADAGYRGDRRAASNLWTKVDIQNRVKELQKLATDQVVIDQAWVLSKLVENAENCQVENPAASNRALELVGKEMGMFIERSVNDNRTVVYAEEPMTLEDWSTEFGDSNETQH